MRSRVICKACELSSYADVINRWSPCIPTFLGGRAAFIFCRSSECSPDFSPTPASSRSRPPCSILDTAKEMFHKSKFNKLSFVWELDRPVKICRLSSSRRLFSPLRNPSRSHFWPGTNRASWGTSRSRPTCLIFCVEHPLVLKLVGSEFSRLISVVVRTYHLGGL